MTCGDVPHRSHTTEIMKYGRAGVAQRLVRRIANSDMWFQLPSPAL